MNYLETIKSKKTFEILFIATVGLSFVLWLIFLFAGGEAGIQFDAFCSRCGNFIADTTNVVGYSSDRDPYHNSVYGFGEKAYPPLTYVLLYFVSRIVNAEAYLNRDGIYFYMWNDVKYLMVFILLMIITIICMYTLIQVVKTGKMSIKIMVAFTLSFSAPMIYSIERGNTIILTVFFCIFYLFYYNSENKILRELALISLAIATAFKMTPALLGIMLLYNKQFKDAFKAVIYGIIMVFGPFLFLHGGFSNIPLMFQNMKLNLHDYTSESGCTLTSSINRFATLRNSEFEITDKLINNMRIVTYIVSGLLLIVVPFFKTNWEKLAAVVVVLIILPSHSGNYCILYMLPVTIMFLNEEKHKYIDYIYLLCMIMISWVFIFKVTEIFNFNLAVPIMAFTLIVTGIINIIKFGQNKLIK